jgi:anaerobic dimethyl sulfoxide reductase subunit B
MSAEYVISFIQENCIQCHGCEVACKSWRNVELGVKWRRVDTVWQGDYPNIKNVSVAVACVHCADPTCVVACPVGAIEKVAKDGVVLVKRDKCIGCQACQAACPYDVPQFGADGTMQKCDMCFHEVASVPHCVRTCPTNALIFTSGSR